MVSGNAGSLSGEAEASPRFEWRVTPWRREPVKAIVTLGVVLVAIAGSWWYAGGEWYAAVLAALILWGSLGPFFVTTRYAIDGEGVEIDSPFLKRRRGWSEIRSYYVDGKGATLSPFAGRSWLEAYRSIRLMFGDHEQEIGTLLRGRLGAPAGTSRPEEVAGATGENVGEETGQGAGAGSKGH